MARVQIKDERGESVMGSLEVRTLRPGSQLAQLTVRIGTDPVVTLALDEDELDQLQRAIVDTMAEIRAYDS